MYNITKNQELTNTFTNISVTAQDYLDFTLSSTVSSEAHLTPGDVYAFTITSSATYYLAGEVKSQESPANYLPAGLTSEMAVTGHGTGSSLTTYNDPTDGNADATFYLKTTAIPEPEPLTLVLAGLATFWFLRRFKNRDPK